MRWKKTLAGLLLCGAMVAVMTACGEQDTPEPNVPDGKIEAQGDSDNLENQDLSEALRSSKTLTAKSTEVLCSIPFPEGKLVDIVQGGWTDGKYFYQAFIGKDTENNELNNAVCIVKYDLENQKTVKESEVLQLNHANDITYNSRLDCLVLCNSNPRKNVITYIDKDELTVIDQFEIGYDIFSIDYNEATDRYVVGIAGGQTFCILDGNFQPVSEIYDPTTRTTDCTTQGVGSDDEFIYFILYNRNVITVYDWDGNFVTLIKLDISNSVEPESIRILEDGIYIGASGAGMQVYRIKGLLPEE